MSRVILDRVTGGAAGVCTRGRDGGTPRRSVVGAGVGVGRGVGAGGGVGAGVGVGGAG